MTFPNDHLRLKQSQSIISVLHPTNDIKQKMVLKDQVNAFCPPVVKKRHVSWKKKLSFDS